MSTFAEYAALARQLAEQRRAPERDGDAERRRNLPATADYLDRRLTAQGERLDQLGRATGQPPATPPAVGSAALPEPRPAEVDPVVALELARRYADEADRYGHQAELLAQRPALLPGWSPIARAAVVHLAAAGVGALVMVGIVLAAGVEVLGYGWLWAGLPAAVLVAGWLALRRWGRPAMPAPGGNHRAVLTRAVLTSRAKRTSGHG
ncbi:hypothetical protein ACVCAH_11965 [Micromonospora sp. LZ34]